MNRMKYILSLLAMVANLLACDDDRNLPAPVGSGSSDEEPQSYNCMAYLSCADLCDDQRCVLACEVATSAPVEFCVAEHCEELLTACDRGDVFSCNELPKCGGYEDSTSSTSSSNDTSSSSGSSSEGDSSESSSSDDSTSTTTEGEMDSSSSGGTSTT